MFDRNRSGQFLYFNMVSALSGNPVTGQAAGISGRLSIDGAAQAVIAGTIGETGGGQYQANLFAADVNGNNLGFLFTASGCVPVSFTVVTQQNVSGRIFAASGVNAIVPIASISGVNPASGAFVAVPPATLSGVIANSGLFVTAPAAGSGLFVTVPIETISGVIPASGGFVTVPKATLSGVVANSGLTVTVIKETISGVVANSGLFTVTTIASGTTFLASGSAVNLLSGNVTSPYSGSMSGQPLTLLSGWSFVASGSVFLGNGPHGGTAASLRLGRDDVTEPALYVTNTSGVAAQFDGGTVGVYVHSVTDVGMYVGSDQNTGIGVVAGRYGVSINTTANNRAALFLTATSPTTAGMLVSVMGHGIQVFAGSGNHGLDINAGSGGIGNAINLTGGSSGTGLRGNIVGNLSGNVWPVSGQTWIASGPFVVAPVSSGTTFLASGSAVNLLSGNVTSPYSGSLSGQQLTARTVTDKSGYILSNSGLDLINVEAGMNMRQAQAIIAAAAGGQLSGAGTATINIDGANASGTTRVTATVSASGNRTAVTLNLPG